MPDTTQPPTEYPASMFPRAARANAERRKVATLREMAKLPPDVLERALESARNEQTGATQ